MKKFLFSSLFAACAAFGLSSCMNGDYDATPNANNGGPNPLANNGGSGNNNGGSSSSGKITCKVDGNSYTFTGSYNVIGSMYTIAGGTSDGTTGRTVSIGITNYGGPNTYDLATAGSGSYGYYPMSNTSDVTVYSTGATGSPGTGTVTVTSDANNELKGTFSFTANKASGSGSATQVIVTEGTFDVMKQ